jgi:Tol biopolymer transport system component
VKVTDARGGWNTGELSIATGKEAPVDRAPVVDTTFQAADTAGGGERLVFRVGGRDPDGTAVSYAWASSAGTLGTVTKTASGESEVVWTAPACLDRTALVSATLTDASGTSTTHVFSVDPGGESTCGVASLELASVSSSRAQGNGQSYWSSLSREGRYVAFVSESSNLTSHVHGGVANVFVRDTWTGTTTLVTASSDGAAAGNGWSDSPSISDDGRYVGFLSSATNLGAPNPGGAQFYVRDMETGSVTLASLDVGGNEVAANVYVGTLSGDGRHACFTTYHEPDAAGDGGYAVYVHDLGTRVTRLLGGYTSGYGFGCSLSYDGRMAAFGTTAALVSADTNDGWDVYVKDMQTGAVALVSQDSSGNATGAYYWPAISRDGTHVGYPTDFPLDPSDRNRDTDVYVRDLTTGAVTWASAPAGTLTFQSAVWPSLSADGAVIAFEGDTGTGRYQVLTRDLRSGALTMQSVSAAGNPAAGDAYSPSISADGRFVSFDSEAANLVAGDTNGSWDVFVTPRR